MQEYTVLGGAGDDTVVEATCVRYTRQAATMHNRTVLGVAGEDAVVEVFAPGDASRSGPPATVRLTSVMQVCPFAML